MNIQFDFRFDTNGFFNDPLRRNTLEAAAQVWENAIKDDFANIAVGTKFTVTNPQTGVTETVILNNEIDDLLIFVGAQSPPFGISGKALARGGFNGTDAAGNIFSHRITGSDFEPWVGNISFNSNPVFSNGSPSQWFFDSTLDTADDLPQGSSDFYTTALHEIAHVLGIGTAEIFQEIGAGASFNGVNAKNTNNGNPVPLDIGLDHIKAGFSYNNEPVLLTGINSGRILPTSIELAILADIGYEIDDFNQQGSLPPLATETAETIFGTILNDVIDGLNGDDQIQGNNGYDLLKGSAGNDIIFGENDDDFLLGGEGEDQLQGGNGNDILNGGGGNDQLFGQAGSDRFIFIPNNGKDNINDFVVAEDFIQISPDLNFTNSQQVLDSITNTGNSTSGGLFSEFTLSPGNTFTVFHDTQFTATNFIFNVKEFPWDIDNNGFVTPTDAIFVINHLGQTVNNDNRLADLDGNGLISDLDAIAVINRMGMSW